MVDQVSYEDNNIFLSLTPEFVEPQSETEALLSLEMDKSRVGSAPSRLLYGKNSKASYPGEYILYCSGTGMPPSQTT